ncbi:MAG: glycosyltransferase family 4 protein [Algoriphagus sp.]|uniref:glycosyltransferase family 4 protein n=1 Tax=Algoriphagus sp. TaxID=1872435 RepID=UPI00182F187B|nr:glycosyltransferase family 4 protein [Algoriphagus sp.]NVJ86766.1 glycosyltransferase family 4 protein [Algoriphagus sp.]
MHIAFLTPEYPHPKIGKSGGLGTSIWGLANILSESGINVTVLVYGKEKDSSFREDGVNFYLIRNIKVKGLSYFLTVKKVQKLIIRINKDDKIDFLEVPDWTGFSAFLKLNIPIVMRLNGSDSYFCHLENRPVKIFNKFLERRAFRRADHIISVSKFTGELTNKLFNLQRSFEIIPNPVDTSKFSNFSNSIQSGVILYFGTLIRKKGLLELPFIFNEVVNVFPDTRLYLVGSDSFDIITGSTSTWQLMEPLFSEAALKNVKYFGPVDYSAIKNHIARANLCVFPSFAEALPVSWLEAMAMGKAIVTSDVGWAPEIIDQGQDGFMVDPKNHKEFAERICQILQYQDLQESLSKNAIHKVNSKFSKQSVFQRYISYYNSLV